MEPGSEGGFDPWILIALAAALFAASVSTTIKDLTRTEAPITILVWSYSLMTILAIIPAYLTWKSPSFEEMVAIAAMSVGTQSM